GLVALIQDKHPSLKFQADPFLYRLVNSGELKKEAAPGGGYLVSQGPLASTNRSECFRQGISPRAIRRRLRAAQTGTRHRHQQTEA
ncbi:MAG TPA: hypothetical protein VHB20_07510, partial [Verrucomicrobiae bacterium]|nr:hypothetical protein [Verrucomicrobiae bacterium]